MKLHKPKFWNKKHNLLSLILFPLTFLYLIIINLRKRYIKPIKFKIKVVCVGNIYLGGTGKTPLAIYLAKEFLKKGNKTAIIRKYYNNHKDEYDMIKQNFKDLIFAKNRRTAIDQAVNEGFNHVILDDGFQDYKIIKDLNIVCFNQNQLIGNGLVMPSGPLRESFKSIKDAQIVVINGVKDINFERKLINLNKKLSIYYSFYVPQNIEKFKNKKLLAFAGIGNPENFFNLLKKKQFKR